MGGVVKGFQIDCDTTGPLGDLTGKGDQSSGKVVHKDRNGPLGDLCNIRLLQSHMRLKKNRPYNHWLKGQGHYLLCFSTSRTVGASSVRL